MGGSSADPKRTYALVVGVEKYTAGQNWYVDGPASDARRFTEWLLGRGVPDENILLFISPIDENRGLLEKDGPAPRPATREQVYTAVTNVLPRKTGDLLYIYWAGHGLITAEGTRRLFYADASDVNKLNLDLNSLLVCLRSDYLPSFDRQVCLVDACANYVEALQLTASLPTETFPAARPRATRQQFVLTGAKAGDFSVVATRRKTGLFSEQVFNLLNSTSASSWPPDMEALTKQLQQRFTDLRNTGETEQTPTYFWYRDWDSGEGTIGRPTAATRPVQPAAPAEARRELRFEQLADLVDGLLACASVSDRARRETIIGQLRPAIVFNTKRSDAAQFDVVNIVETCLEYPDGIDELLRVVRFFERDSFAIQKLDVAAARIFTL